MGILAGPGMSGVYTGEREEGVSRGSSRGGGETIQGGIKMIQIFLKLLDV